MSDLKGFEGKTLDEITVSVGKSVADNKFEAAIKAAYPRDMSDLDRTTLWTALHNNMQNNRKEHFKKYYGIIIQSLDGNELEVLSVEEICAANNEVYYINEPFTKAMEFLQDYKR